jgi:hypothetical protein
VKGRGKIMDLLRRGCGGQQKVKGWVVWGGKREGMGGNKRREGKCAAAGRWCVIRTGSQGLGLTRRSCASQSVLERECEAAYKYVMLSLAGILFRIMQLLIIPFHF